MSRITRRSFLQTTLAGATVAISGTKSSGRVIGANDTIRVAVAGINDRGGTHIKEFSSIPGVAVTHLVDPDTRTFAKRQKQLAELKKPEATCVQDIRKVLENKDVDVVTIATPNHWHSLMTIWACQAGKDVYVEKPVSHNVHEGRVAVDSARKHNRIVQHGTQRRSWGLYQNLAAVVRSGHYGPLRMSRGIVYKLRKSIGVKPETTPPAEVDFDLWTGPAPKHPFHTNLVHYNWHWFWDFGNGDIGNQGVHQMDIARWMIPNATLPKSVVSLGGRFGYTDQGETPNTQLALFDFGAAKLLFEVRGLETAKYPHDDKNEGSVLHFDDGVIANFKFYRKGQSEGEPIPTMETKTADKKNDHINFVNFIDCVRSRKQEQLNADILEGHYSSALCHLANVSYRLGSEAPFKPRPNFGNGDPAIKQTMELMEEHLVKSGKMNLDESKIRVGKMLKLDSSGEGVLDANTNVKQLLTRNNRAPFTVSEKV
jgi:predicted dehydrogenase